MVLDIYPSDLLTYKFFEDEGTTDIQGEQTELGLEISWEGHAIRSFIIRLHTGWTPQSVAKITPSGTDKINWREINSAVFQIELPECDSGRLEIRR